MGRSCSPNETDVLIRYKTGDQVGLVVKKLTARVNEEEMKSVMVSKVAPREHVSCQNEHRLLLSFRLLVTIWPNLLIRGPVFRTCRQF